MTAAERQAMIEKFEIAYANRGLRALGGSVTAGHDGDAPVTFSVDEVVNGSRHNSIHPERPIHFTGTVVAFIGMHDDRGRWEEYCLMLTDSGLYRVLVQDLSKLNDKPQP